MTGERYNTWQDRFIRSGYFLGVVLLHLIAFLLLATLVIWQAPVPPPDAAFKVVSIQPPPPPPPEAPSAGDAAQNPQLEPQPVIVPVVTPPSVHTTLNSSFTVNTVNVLNDALTHLKPLPAEGTGLTQGAGDTGQGSGNGFGSSTGTSNQLVGYLYDLKQTADGKPTGMTPALYHQILTKFVGASWDESILAPYYKSSKPLYASQILVPNMDSQEGPKAFGLEKEVQPRMWLIWYKGKVTAPATADYRFAGFCDDILVVRIGGRTVLDGSIAPVATQLSVVTPWPNKWIVIQGGGDNYGQLREGILVSLTQGQPTDMDIIIGEEPGGNFNASLFVLRTDETYQINTAGEPLLPLFQLGEGNLHPGGVHPPVSDTPESW